MLSVFADAAERAEAVRRGGAEVVFVAGCEISAFGTGFIPGATYRDRMRTIDNADMEWWSSLGPVLERLNELSWPRARTSSGPVSAARITYAAAPWEFVDWEPFDIVGADTYRAAYNAGTFREELREKLRKHGKPGRGDRVARTCAWRGAGERGGMAWLVPEDAVRDEGEQVRYFTELLDVFEERGWTPRSGSPSRASATSGTGTSPPTAWSGCSTGSAGHRRRCSTRWRPGTPRGPAV